MSPLKNLASKGQAIITCINADLLSDGPLGINICEIWINTQKLQLGCNRPPEKFLDSSCWWPLHSLTDLPQDKMAAILQMTF